MRAGHPLIRLLGFYEEATATAVKETIAWQISRVMEKLRLTKTEMAERMGTSRELLGEDRNVRLLRARGREAVHDSLGGDGPRHDLPNGVERESHHALRCAGVIRISGRAPDDLVFELPLGRFRSGDVYS